MHKSIFPALLFWLCIGNIFALRFISVLFVYLILISFIDSFLVWKKKQYIPCGEINVINITHHSRKSLLFDKIFSWAKKWSNSYCDGTMGSYDRAEICELVVLYLLNRISTAIDKSTVGLYGPAGTNETVFFDVTFTLATKKKYFSFWIANNAPLYNNAFSNHPLTIIKQLPKMVSKRISDWSCNKEEFD